MLLFSFLLVSHLINLQTKMICLSLLLLSIDHSNWQMFVTLHYLPETLYQWGKTTNWHKPPGWRGDSTGGQRLQTNSQIWTFPGKICKGFPKFIKEKYFRKYFQFLPPKLILQTKSASEAAILRSRRFFRHPYWWPG